MKTIMLPRGPNQEPELLKFEEGTVGHSILEAYEKADLAIPKVLYPILWAHGLKRN